MGIYISGMEMPVCHFKTSESYNVHGFWMVYPDGKSKLHIVVGSDNFVCEAIPVTDHGRLGDLDKLKQKALMRSERRGRLVNCTDMVISAYDIELAPTIIPASPADKEVER